MTSEAVYLVSYDIADRRRWRRVFKTLKRVGQHVQLSVFLCRLRPARMERVKARLSGLIDQSEDRLLVVALGSPTSAAGRLHGTDAAALLEPPRALVL